MISLAELQRVAREFRDAADDHASNRSTETSTRLRDVHEAADNALMLLANGPDVIEDRPEWLWR
jgi:hypothetical protein